MHRQIEETHPSLKGIADISASELFILIKNGGLGKQGYYGENKIQEYTRDVQVLHDALWELHALFKESDVTENVVVQMHIVNLIHELRLDGTMNDSSEFSDGEDSEKSHDLKQSEVDE